MRVKAFMRHLKDEKGGGEVKYEKSCGAVVLSQNERGDRFVLMIKSYPNGGSSFPKGHMEQGETERRTAVREVLEETAVRIKITEKFRHTVHYNLRPGVRKEVVYFLAYTEMCEAIPRQGEIACAEWVPLGQAMDRLGHSNDRAVFSHAMKYCGFSLQKAEDGGQGA